MRRSLRGLKRTLVVLGMMRSAEPFNAELGAALLRFNEEAVPYCQRISDADAHNPRQQFIHLKRLAMRSSVMAIAHLCWGLRIGEC